MPEAQRPRSKRAVPTARVVAAEAPPVRAAKRHIVPPLVVLPDPVPSRRPGFRVPAPAPPIVDDDDIDVEEPGVNYALRLTEALEAISSAQSNPQAPRPAARLDPSPPPSPRGSGGAGFFSNLPPIRLPIGPPIPWRFGVPALVVLVGVMIFVARPMSQADSQVSRLPSPVAYPVQQEAPLFTDAQPTPVPAPALGIADAGGVGFDVVDIGLKLVAVLALAYGSLLLLKRAGMGGAGAIKIGGKGSAGLQIVASLSLAPNRTVHVLKVPGGKTVLVGATPTQINLIVDLGESLEPDLESETASSFFDILKGKIPK